MDHRKEPSTTVEEEADAKKNENFIIREEVKTDIFLGDRPYSPRRFDNCTIKQQRSKQGNSNQNFNYKEKIVDVFPISTASSI